MDIPPSTQKPKGNFSIIILILVSFFLTLSFLYFGYQLSVSKKQKVTPPTPILSISPFDETANWKTYRNENMGFYLKYPNQPNWLIREESENFIALYNYDVNKAPGRSYDPIADKDLFKIEITKDTENSDVDQWFNEEKLKTDPTTDKPTEFLNVKNITVDGYKGIFYETKSWGITSGTAVFKTPGISLIHFIGGLNYEGNKKTFNQILSSFKFYLFIQ